MCTSMSAGSKLLLVLIRRLLLDLLFILILLFVLIIVLRLWFRLWLRSGLNRRSALQSLVAGLPPFARRIVWTSGTTRLLLWSRWRWWSR